MAKEFQRFENTRPFCTCLSHYASGHIVEIELGRTTIGEAKGIDTNIGGRFRYILMSGPWSIDGGPGLVLVGLHYNEKSIE